MNPRHLKKIGQKIGRGVLGLFLVLLVLEVTLRGLGAAMVAWQNFLNGDQGVRILTLGESTSADNMAPNGQSWPRMLNQMLHAHGIKASVINKARAATTTGALMTELISLLSETKPQIVVTMMGINDSTGFQLKKAGLISDSDTFWSNLRLVKMARAFLLIFNKDKRSEIKKEPLIVTRDNFNIPNEKELIKAFKTGKFKEANAIVQKFLEDKQRMQRGQFYTWLANEISPEYGADEVKYDLSYHFYKEAFENAIEVDHLVENILFRAMRRKDQKTCEIVAHKIIDKKNIPSDIAITRLGICLGVENLYLKQILAASGDRLEFVLNSNVNPTKENYKYLYKTLHEKNICLVVMQYPTLPIEELQEYLKEVNPEIEKDPKLKFVGNQDNFKKALEASSYEKIFYDRFATTFGHATEVGNQLIASNLNSQILEMIRSGNCSP